MSVAEIIIRASVAPKFKDLRLDCQLYNTRTVRFPGT